MDDNNDVDNDTDGNDNPYIDMGEEKVTTIYSNGTFCFPISLSPVRPHNWNSFIIPKHLGMYIEIFKYNIYTVMECNALCGVGIDNINIMLFSIVFEYNHPITKVSTCVKMSRNDRNKKTC